MLIFAGIILGLVLAAIFLGVGCELGQKFTGNQAQKLVVALEKIADPRLRDHTEPDSYTELGCVMNIANEALEDWKNP